MTAYELQLRGYRLTTAEIVYHLPDHPALLQSFIWQKFDLAPDYPELQRFLEFWSRNIEGPPRQAFALAALKPRPATRRLFAAAGGAALSGRVIGITLALMLFCP